MPRLEKVTLHLTCDLTDAEVRDYAEQLADAHRRIQREKENLKSVSAQIKSEITLAEAKANNCAEKVNSKQEFRDIECRIIYDFAKREKTTVRTDTGATVKTERIHDDELQEDLGVNLVKEAEDIINRPKPEDPDGK